MKVPNISNVFFAALGATRDRRFITKSCDKNLNNIERVYFEKLVEKSGPSAHSLKRIVHSWKRAYDSNMEKEKYITAMRNQFKEPGLVSKIFNRLTHK